MNNNKALGIQLISYFYIFGIAVVFITLFSASANISGHSFPVVIGLPFLPDLAAKALLIVLSSIVVFGFFNLKTWGYWAMLFYSAYFLLVSTYLSGMYTWQPFVGTIIWSLIVIIYTISKRKIFIR